MLTIKRYINIIGGELKDAHNKEANEINDFETIYKFVNSKMLIFSNKRNMVKRIRKK